MDGDGFFLDGRGAWWWTFNDGVSLWSNWLQQLFLTIKTNVVPQVCKTYIYQNLCISIPTPTFKI